MTRYLETRKHGKQNAVASQQASNRKKDWLVRAIGLAVLALAIVVPAAGADLDYLIADPDNLPYSTDDREDLSLQCGGGKGVLIAPNWALTASHCIGSKLEKKGDVSVRFKLPDGHHRVVKVDRVLRHAYKDLALLRLERRVEPQEREPIILIRDALKPSDAYFQNNRVPIKKVAGNAAWRGIPALPRNDHLFIPEKKHRRGKAGTSGSPWVIHTPSLGDVLVGITHGSGRSPQIGYCSKWIENSVRQNSDNRIIWATKQMVLPK